NKNWKNARFLMCVAAMAITAVGCNKASSPAATEDKAGLTQEESALRQKTRQVAEETLGLVLTGKTEAGHSENFSGLRTENLTFTQRLDSRTYIAYDKRFSQIKTTGMYKEPDEALLKRSADLLERLKIPRNEVEPEKRKGPPGRRGSRQEICANYAANRGSSRFFVAGNDRFAANRGDRFPGGTLAGDSGESH